MKKVFISVSILALVYLTLQSGLASKLSLPKSFTLFNETQATDGSSSKQAILTTELAQALQTLQTMQTENNALKEKITNLESAISSLQSNLNKATSKENISKESSDYQEPEQAVVQTNTQAHLPTLEQADSDNDKRLRQQAMLRSLSQRMELAALSSLTK